jgi:ABC-type multidrug transport system ATPase subunit
MDAGYGQQTVLGIAAGSPGEASAVADLLSGLARPAHGELRVLGQDMTTPQGRAAARKRVGVARRLVKARAAFRVRGLVEHAARLAGVASRDRELFAAAVIDRLSLTPWADVSLRAAPEVIARRAVLAAGTVHQPDLLVIDGLLDELAPRERAALADGINELKRDMAMIVAGCEAPALGLVCDEILTLSDGVLLSA